VLEKRKKNKAKHKKWTNPKNESIRKKIRENKNKKKQFKKKLK